MKITYELALQQLQATSADKQVLELLSATQGFLNDNLKQLSAKQLICVGEELGLSEASVRMALSRQTKAGKLARINGLYGISKQQKPFSLPRFWLKTSKRSMNWQDQWLLFSAAQGKLDTTTARRLGKRANLLGLRHIPNLGYMRPANLQDLAAEVRFHFESVAPKIRWTSATLVDLDKQSKLSWPQMWPVDALNEFYSSALEFIEYEFNLIDELDARRVMNRSFACGRLIVENLAVDPWLPAQWVDGRARNELLDRTLDYYQKIMPIWLQVLENELA